MTTENEKRVKTIDNSIRSVIKELQAGMTDHKAMWFKAQKDIELSREKADLKESKTTQVFYERMEDIIKSAKDTKTKKEILAVQRRFDDLRTTLDTQKKNMSKEERASALKAMRYAKPAFQSTIDERSGLTGIKGTTGRFAKSAGTDIAAGLLGLISGSPALMFLVKFIGDELKLRKEIKKKEKEIGGEDKLGVLGGLQEDRKEAVRKVKEEKKEQKKKNQEQEETERILQDEVDETLDDAEETTKRKKQPRVKKLDAPTELLTGILDYTIDTNEHVQKLVSIQDEELDISKRKRVTDEEDSRESKGKKSMFGKAKEKGIGIFGLIMKFLKGTFAKILGIIVLGAAAFFGGFKIGEYLMEHKEQIFKDFKNGLAKIGSFLADIPSHVVTATKKIIGGFWTVGELLGKAIYDSKDEIIGFSSFLLGKIKGLFLDIGGVISDLGQQAMDWAKNKWDELLGKDKKSAQDMEGKFIARKFKKKKVLQFALKQQQERTKQLAADAKKFKWQSERVYGLGDIFGIKEMEYERALKQHEESKMRERVLRGQIGKIDEEENSRKQKAADRKVVQGSPTENKLNAGAIGRFGRSGAAAKTVPGITASADGKEIGFLSAQFESRGDAGTISSGRGDPGGKSYGKHQLSLNKGTLQKYLDQSQYASMFKGLTPGSAAFDKQWKALAKSDPGFAADQHDFLKKTHYDPIVAEASKLGFDVNNPGVREALFSGSIQHGGIRKIMRAAAQGGLPDDAAGQVGKFYEARTKYVARLDLNASQKRGIFNRYRQESRIATQLASAAPQRTLAGTNTHGPQLNAEASAESATRQSTAAAVTPIVLAMNTKSQQPRMQQPNQSGRPGIGSSVDESSAVRNSGLNDHMASTGATPSG